MTVLIQYPVTEPGHSWDHLHENSEVLGRVTWPTTLLGDGVGWVCATLIALSPSKEAPPFEGFAPPDTLLRFAQALLANSLPSEHLALTRTVVRLLRFRTATLPEFLDSVCWGTCHGARIEGIM